MSETIQCARCARAAETLGEPPQPGEVGKEIQAKVCRECWQEWQKAEIMVINELRLNFMDPESQTILAQHMREFLCLGARAAD